MFEIIIGLSSLLYRELREIVVKLLDKGLSVSIWTGIHIQKSWHQSLFFWAQSTTDPKLHSGSKPLLKNKRNPFSLLWVKSMTNLFVGQFSNFKFHISLMESNNMELILVWWSNTKEVYTHTQLSHIVLLKLTVLQSRSWLCHWSDWQSYSEALFQQNWNITTSPPTSQLPVH